MIFEPALTLGTIRRFVVRAMFIALSLAPIASRAQALGVLAGSVTDAFGGVLPGVTVAVSGAGVRASTVTDQHGHYELTALPAGTYTATVELAGFETAIQRDIVVQAGGTVTAPFALELGCIMEVQLVDMGLRQALQDTTVVAHIRISEAGQGAPCPGGGFCVCTEHVALVKRVLKTPSGDAVPRTIRFLQEGAGRLRAKPRLVFEKSYASGEEYIAFLYSHPRTGHLQRFSGPLYMFPVRNGRVEFRRTDAPGISNGMRVEDFSRAARALLPSQF